MGCHTSMEKINVKNSKQEWFFFCFYTCLFSNSMMSTKVPNGLRDNHCMSFSPALPRSLAFRIMCCARTESLTGVNYNYRGVRLRERSIMHSELTRVLGILNIFNAFLLCSWKNTTHLLLSSQLFWFVSSPRVCTSHNGFPWKTTAFAPPWT